MKNKDLNRKILIVDDDMFLLDMYALKFKESGFEVEFAMNGNEALKKIESLSKLPDIILLDILMPIMDGFETLKNIKENQSLKNVKVVILSNLGQKEEINKSLGLGADDFIIKAHNTPSEVVEKVKKIMSE